MPPRLAAFLTVGFILFLYWRDRKTQGKMSGALWLPLIWMLICGSRFVSDWLNQFGFSFGAISLEEGSPLDRSVFIALILGALFVLHQRRVQLATVFRANAWLTAFLLYCLLAVLWSDYPFVSLKRWVKVIGQPLMILVILSEPDPIKALTFVMKRCAYVLLPVSILYIKYFPHLGRDYEIWSGAVMFKGVAGNKNLLGADCLILGFFLVWHFVRTYRQPRSRARRNELILAGGLIWMVWWLLSASNSKTPLGALVLGVAVMLFASSSWVNKRALGTYFIVGAVGVILLQNVFDLYGLVLSLLGRNATLTERTFLWEDLLNTPVNPLLGAGFESFWLGDRLKDLWVRHPWRPNQAHNGYLETYLTLGLFGLALLIGLLIATFGKARRDLLRGLDFGGFRIGFLAAIVVYNWTEAAFKTIHFVFFAFYIIALDYPKRNASPVNRMPPRGSGGASPFEPEESGGERRRRAVAAAHT